MVEYFNLVDHAPQDKALLNHYICLLGGRHVDNQSIYLTLRIPGAGTSRNIQELYHAIQSIILLLDYLYRFLLVRAIDSVLSDMLYYNYKHWAPDLRFYAKEGYLYRVSSYRLSGLGQVCREYHVSAREDPSRNDFARYFIRDRTIHSLPNIIFRQVLLGIALLARHEDLPIEPLRDRLRLQLVAIEEGRPGSVYRDSRGQRWHGARRRG